MQLLDTLLFNNVLVGSYWLRGAHLFARGKTGDQSQGVCWRSSTNSYYQCQTTTNLDKQLYSVYPSYRIMKTSHGFKPSCLLFYS